MPTQEINPETLRLAQSFANTMREPVVIYRSSYLKAIDYVTQTVWDLSTAGHEFIRAVYPLNLLKALGAIHE